MIVNILCYEICLKAKNTPYATISRDLNSLSVEHKFKFCDEVYEISRIHINSETYIQYYIRRHFDDLEGFLFFNNSLLTYVFKSMCLNFFNVF